MSSNLYASASALDIVPLFSLEIISISSVESLRNRDEYFASLGRNGGGGRDGVCWADEEGDEELADSGLGRVFETTIGRVALGFRLRPEGEQRPTHVGEHMLP